MELEYVISSGYGMLCYEAGGRGSLSWQVLWMMGCILLGERRIYLKGRNCVWRGLLVRME